MKTLTSCFGLCAREGGDLGKKACIYAQPDRDLQPLTSQPKSSADQPSSQLWLCNGEALPGRGSFPSQNSLEKGEGGLERF